MSMEFAFRRNVNEPWFDLRLSDGYGSSGQTRYALHRITYRELHNAYSPKEVWRSAIELMVHEFNTLGKKVKLIEFNFLDDVEGILPLPYGLGLKYWDEP